MNEAIEHSVAFFVDIVIDYAAVISRTHERVKDLAQAKVVYQEAARRIDRSSRGRPRYETEVDDLFRHISYLQDGRFRDDEETIGMLGLSYFLVGQLVAKSMRNVELSALGRAGGRKRYEAMRKLEAWTLSEYRQGNWKSANQAAHALKDAVLAQSRALEANLTESNAQRTIAEWINRDKKRSSG